MINGITYTFGSVKMRLINILIIFVVAPLLSMAQHETPPPPPSSSVGDKIFTGGSLGLQFGTYTVVEISPIIGYKVTERFTPGISITYIYSKIKDPWSGYTYSTNIYGGSVFARYYLLDNVF